MSVISSQSGSDHPDESLRLLADAGTLLNATLDYDRILENLAHLVVPRFADWCTLDTVEDDDEVHRFAVVSGNPGDAPLVARAREVEMIDRSAEFGPVEVIRSGEAIFVPQVDAEDISTLSSDAETAAVYGELDAVSAMIVPIAAKGLVCGALTLLTTTPDRRYSASDLLVAQDIGRRAGVAIDNARRYEDIHRIAGELQQANDAKDEFLGMISHELRTPITVIYGGARVLRVRGNSLAPERQQALIVDIEEEADRLHRIVEDLLALSRVQVDDTFEAEPVMLQRVLPQIAARFEHRNRREVVIEVDGDLPPAAADEGYINQVLRNLLSNAHKYSETGPPIELVLERVGADTCKVSVLDRGHGVSDEDLERIFERFYRSPETAPNISGAGMGLAVCRRLISAMSGEIVAERRPGGGTIFWFTLPIYTGGMQ